MSDPLAPPEKVTLYVCATGACDVVKLKQDVCRCRTTPRPGIVAYGSLVPVEYVPASSVEARGIVQDARYVLKQLSEGETVSDDWVADTIAALTRLDAHLASSVVPGSVRLGP